MNEQKETTANEVQLKEQSKVKTSSAKSAFTPEDSENGICKGGNKINNPDL